MNNKQIQEADYLDILFDGRNKAYGSYELRKHYGQRTKRAVITVVSAVALAMTYPLFASNERPVRTVEIIANIGKPPVVEPPRPKKVLEAALPRATAATIVHPPTIANPLPEIVPNELVRDAPHPKDSIPGAVVGQVNDLTGDPNAIAQSGPHTGDPHTGVIDAPPIKAAGIATVVDQLAEFNGNIGQWLSDHLEYPARAQEENFEGKVYIQFVVSEDGSISDVTVGRSAGHGLDEEAMRVVKMMPRWKAARLNGNPVKTRFILPIAFVLDNK